MTDGEKLCNDEIVTPHASMTFHLLRVATGSRSGRDTPRKAAWAGDGAITTCFTAAGVRVKLASSSSAMPPMGCSPNDEYIFDGFSDHTRLHIIWILFCHVRVYVIRLVWRIMDVRTCVSSQHITLSDYAIWWHLDYGDVMAMMMMIVIFLNIWKYDRMRVPTYATKMNWIIKVFRFSCYSWNMTWLNHLFLYTRLNIAFKTHISKNPIRSNPINNQHLHTSPTGIPSKTHINRNPRWPVSHQIYFISISSKNISNILDCQQRLCSGVRICLANGIIHEMLFLFIEYSQPIIRRTDLSIFCLFAKSVLWANN